MSIYEYNEEYVKKTLFEDGYENGYDTGKFETLVNNVESAMKNFNIDLEKACNGLGVSVTEYTNAKAKIQNK
ncbi:MAG: hypothetical protein J6B68_02770 [Lachnospiraceae bacterium]|nr:hypothetical protein [Lachnospiraceae bacterium]